MASELQSRCEMTNQEIIETIKYLNFCGLCTTGDCKNCVRKIAKDKVLELLEKDTAKYPIEHTKQVGFPFYECPVCGEKDVYAEKFCSECGQKFDWSNTQIEDRFQLLRRCH